MTDNAMAKQTLYPSNMECNKYTDISSLKLEKSHDL
jgi:hypothetical protein